MKQSQIAAQLYSFRDFIKTPSGVEETFQKLHAMGYQAVQLSSSLAKMPEEELAALLKQYELVPCSTHEGGTEILEKTDEIIVKLQKLHCTHLAYPGPHVNLTGEMETIALAHRLNEAAKKFAANGILLSYHNHAIEFKRFGEKTILELIYENAPDLEAELDTHWVHRGGGDVIGWIRKCAGNMSVIHLKDYGVDSKDRSSLWTNVPVMKPIGAGNLDWRRILPEAEKIGVKWFVVEHDADVDDPFASFGESMKYLQQYGKDTIL